MPKGRIEPQNELVLRSTIDTVYINSLIIVVPVLLSIVLLNSHHPPNTSRRSKDT